MKQTAASYETLQDEVASAETEIAVLETRKRNLEMQLEAERTAKAQDLQAFEREKAALVVRVGETQRRLDEREAQHTEALKSIAAGQEMQVFVCVLCVCTRRQKPRHAGESALGAET